MPIIESHRRQPCNPVNALACWTRNAALCLVALAALLSACGDPPSSPSEAPLSSQRDSANVAATVANLKRAANDARDRAIKHQQQTSIQEARSAQDAKTNGKKR